MRKSPEDTDPSSWHRFFAIENNNRAWELAGKASRTTEQSLEMLNTAHAAAVHWNSVGTDLNRMRAKSLLSEVHALLGFGESALTLSSKVKAYFLARETEDWELAFVHTIHAHAAATAGVVDQHLDSYQTAQQAIRDLSDEEDRKVVLLTFRQVPQPGK
jgi:hypothetical protein